MQVLEEKNGSTRFISETTKKTNFSMELLLRMAPMNLPKAGDLVEGRVLQHEGSCLFVDIQPFGTGVIYGREYLIARESIKSLRTGDSITAKVVDAENENGYIELSLKEAGQEMIWHTAEEIKNSQEILSLQVLDANKGGLILDWKGLQGFLPASQLRVAHYPRVEGGDKERILDELKKLVGTKINVTIIDIDSKENKLIFSEKETEANDLKELISKYKIGDVVEGTITGIVDFGVLLLFMICRKLLALL